MRHAARLPFVVSVVALCAVGTRATPRAQAQPVLAPVQQPAIDPVRAVIGDGPSMTQFVLPLHPLASGLYIIEFVGTNENGSVSERLPFRVGG